MFDSDCNKNPEDVQDGNAGNQQKSISTSVTPKLPSRKNYYTTEQVAKIIGVTKQAVIKWRKQKIFMEDLIDHKGVYLYSKERVAQLKSVYHKGWQNETYNRAEIPVPPNKTYYNVRNMSAGQNFKLNQSLSSNLPANTDLEKPVLSALLVNNGAALPTVASILAPEDFFDTRNKTIFESMLRINSQFNSIDIRLLIEDLKNHKLIDSAGGYTYVFMLEEISYSNALVEIHSNVIKEKSELRKLILLGESIAKDASIGTKSIKDILAAARPTFEAIQVPNLPVISRKDYFKNHYVNDVLAADSFRNRKTGFYNIDFNQSFNPGLYIVGAVPAAGKSTFCWQLLEQLADRGEKCLYFSCEIAAKHLFAKSISRAMFNHDPFTDITSTKILRGGVSNESMELVEQFANSDSGVDVIEFSNETIDDLLNLIRAYVLPNRTLTVCIDYLQPIRTNSDSKREGLDDILRKISDFKRKTNTTFIVVSSFNRTNYAEQISFESFKETGGVEYFADVLWGLQLYQLNEVKYGAAVSKTRQQLEEAKRKQPREVQLVCLKNRFGYNYDCFFKYYSKNDCFVPCDGFEPADNYFNDSDNDPE